MSDEIPICHSAESKSLSPSNRHHLAIYLVLYLRYFGQTLAPRFARMARLFESQSPVKGPLIFTLLLTASQPSIPPAYHSTLQQQRSHNACAANQSCFQVSPLSRTPYCTLRNWHKAHSEVGACRELQSACCGLNMWGAEARTQQVGRSTRAQASV